MKFGATMKFVPSGFLADTGGMMFQKYEIPSEVEGDVVYINHKHRFYRVRFKVFGVVLYECFKF